MEPEKAKSETRTAQTEGVIVILEGKVPTHIIRSNGEVLYYKLEKMGMGDHTEFWGAEKISSKPTVKNHEQSN
jgi:hypothetical protein